MKPFKDISRSLFTRFQEENMDPALSLIGDGLSKIGLRNQFCARLLGFRSYEAMLFNENSKIAADSEPMPFSFDSDYSKVDAVVLQNPRVKIPDHEESPYPDYAEYLQNNKPVKITLNSTPLLLSLLPILLDDRTKWHPHSLNICDHTFDVEAQKLKVSKDRSQIEHLSLTPNDSVFSSPYAGLLESVKLLLDTNSVPPDLMGKNAHRNALWINEHMLHSLEQLNATVKAAFDEHLKRVQSIEMKGLMAFTAKDIASGCLPQTQ